MSFYQEAKSARGAAIGTIMPWGGGLTSIPAGWLICDGQFVEANDFPLLAQTIGDTYNAGTSDFIGTGSNSFPNYGGSIKLPNLNGKTLMDMEGSYFAGASASGGTDRAADKDSVAYTLMDPLIGTNEDQGIVTIFNDVYVDLVFNINADDRTGYQGRIKGNTLIDGEGFKTVYIAPRKLGRCHVKRHNHTGKLETIDKTDETKPGDGVVPYGTIYYTLFATAVDNDGSNRDEGETADEMTGETYYFGYTNDDEGWKEDSPAEDGSGNSTVSATTSGNSNEYGGIVAGRLSNPGATPSSSNIVDTYTLQWPTSDLLSGFLSGTQGTTVAKAHSEQPPINMKPKFLSYSPLSNIQEFVQGKHLEGIVESGIGGNSITIPPGYRNNYSNSQSQVGDTLISNTGINFTNESSDDTIIAHTHDEFDVSFDSSRMRAQSNLTVDVNLPNTVNLDNIANKNALQIDFNIEQPRMTSIYIIRAY